MLIPNRRLADALAAQAGVPAVDIGHGQPADHRAINRVALHERHATGLVAQCRDRPRRPTHLEPCIERLGHCAISLGSRRLDGERRRDDLRIGQQATPDERKVLAEQLLGDHHALDLVGAFVDLGGLARPSVWCCVRCAVPLSCDDSPSHVQPCWRVSSSTGDETRGKHLRGRCRKRFGQSRPVDSTMAISVRSRAWCPHWRVRSRRSIPAVARTGGRPTPSRASSGASAVLLPTASTWCPSRWPSRTADRAREPGSWVRCDRIAGCRGAC